MSYLFRLDQFEGPLELLLHLIEKEELDITRVSLSAVTDQYLDHIRSRDDILLENLAGFLSVAARLVLLKSRALLPVLRFTNEEEESIDDLEWQLREYQRWKGASLRLGAWFAVRPRSFARESFFGATTVFQMPTGLTVEMLRTNYLSVLGEIPLFEKLEERVIEEVMTLETKISDLQVHLAKRLETSFREFTVTAESKIEVIISFLALLELVKQRFLEVEQGEFFGDIRIRRGEVVASGQ